MIQVSQYFSQTFSIQKQIRNNSISVLFNLELHHDAYIFCRQEKSANMFNPIELIQFLANNILIGYYSGEYEMNSDLATSSIIAI